MTNTVASAVPLPKQNTYGESCKSKSLGGPTSICRKELVEVIKFASLEQFETIKLVDPRTA